MLSFQFGNILFEGNLPDGIPVGEFLLPFTHTERKQYRYLVRLTAEQGDIEVPTSAADTGDYYYEADRGRLVSRYAFLKEAAAYYPADWHKDEFHFIMSPELLNTSKFTLNHLLPMIGIHGALLHRGALVIHASYILVDGEAILFLGPSGTGKSTQAGLWERYAGAEIVNGDRALLYMEGTRLFAGGISVCGSSNICKDISAPVRAIVILKQEPENAVRAMRPSRIYGALLAGAHFHHWSEEENRLAGNLAAEVMENTQIVSFGCLPDRTAVEELQRYLK